MKEIESKRLLSLDALRGLDMLMITGFGHLIVTLCVAFGYGKECWLATQLRHVPWEGCRIEDCLFPLFLFISGVSFPYSRARQVEKGVPTGCAVANIVRRGLILFFLGLVINGFFRFQFATLRIPSVLGLIGLSWALAALLYVFCRDLRARIAVCAVLLVGVALAMFFIPAPDFPEAARFSREGNILCWLDRVLTPGHIYTKTFDPEGLPRVLTGLVTASLGMFAGDFIRCAGLSGNRKTLVMIALGAVLAAVGWTLHAVGFSPVNKALWSPAFVLVTGGYSFVLLAIFYWLVDVKLWRGWTFVLRVVGMNAIAIYVGRRFISIDYAAKFFFGGAAAYLPAAWGEVLLSFGYCLVAWLLLYFLYRKDTFIRV